MTLPATGSCGAPEDPAGVGAAEDASGTGFGCCGVVDDGRDQPGPGLLTPEGPAVSLVVTSRE